MTIHFPEFKWPYGKGRSLSCVLLLIFFLSSRHAISAFHKEMVMVPMSDGIRLATDIYRPTTEDGPWPTVLVRTPYDREYAVNDLLVGTLTDLRHYTLVIQNTRGRFDSEGVDSLYFSDGWGRIRDGYDTVEWIARQSWSNGKIGGWGASGPGIAQYLLAGAAPPHLLCSLIMVAASNLYEDALFYGGAYRRSLVDNWLQDNDSGQFIDYFVQNPNYGNIYDIVNLATRYDSVKIPIYHVGGWQDIFIQGQINAFTGIQEHGGPGAAGYQRLLIGPWVHNLFSTNSGELTFPNASILPMINGMIDWFDYWLKDENRTNNERPRVRYYLMGDADQADGPGNRWVEREDWPPSSTPSLYYLHEGGLLSPELPIESELPEAFDYNPENPVPTVGGRNLSLPAGSFDQRSVESRPDVLVYTSDPLLDSLMVVGRVTVTLWASSDGPDTDFTAKLCDVYPDGRSMLVADGIVQARHRHSIRSEEFLVPGEIVEFSIDLWSTAIVFAPGHCIRICISSSNYERFENNPNTGEPFRQHTTSRIAHQTVYHDAEHPSAIVLPVVTPESSEIAVNEYSGPGYPILEQNFPNPFNHSTRIQLRIPESPNGQWHSGGEARLEILDIRGRCMIFWEISPQSDNLVTIHWSGDDIHGRPLPSGIYMSRFTTRYIIETRKMTLLR